MRIRLLAPAVAVACALSVSGCRADLPPKLEREISALHSIYERECDSPGQVSDAELLELNRIMEIILLPSLPTHTEAVVRNTIADVGAPTADTVCSEQYAREFQEATRANFNRHMNEILSEYRSNEAQVVSAFAEARAELEKGLAD
ncbi:hypothetical protein ACIBFB_01670 [Nocardiopsis sp. NPDC050513]|uniref:hypothetical protein n=1 Tax=Nocardiopsis sp. NPDC050513 TaxID=3364338 RepID=UPI0037BDC9A6